MRPSIDCSGIPFRIKSSEVVIHSQKGNLALPSIMALSGLAADSSVGVDVPLGISSRSRCLPRITQQGFHVWRQILNIDHRQCRDNASPQAGSGRGRCGDVLIHNAGTVGLVIVLKLGASLVFAFDQGIVFLGGFLDALKNRWFLFLVHNLLRFDLDEILAGLVHPHAPIGGHPYRPIGVLFFLLRHHGASLSGLSLFLGIRILFRGTAPGESRDRVGGSATAGLATRALVVRSGLAGDAANLAGSAQPGSGRRVVGGKVLPQALFAAKGFSAADSQLPRQISNDLPRVTRGHGQGGGDFLANVSVHQRGFHGRQNGLKGYRSQFVAEPGIFHRPEPL
mmetsp:Transcript_4493/g.12973  ORF Transcript_4493/g.12973 Transcript_4493/m.12973 type:complete len:338 (+) Transcript_4493:1252-2265(+)